MQVMKHLVVAGALALAVTSCKKPVPPQIVVEGAKVTKVGLGGVEVTVHVAATNPNSFDMTFKSVTAQLTLAGKYPLGQTKLTQAISIPKGQTVQVDVPMTSAWQDMTTLGILAAQNAAIPYTVNGTFAIGGDTLAVNIPWSAQGTITHELLVASMLESSGLPGLPIPLPKH